MTEFYSLERLYGELAGDFLTPATKISALVSRHLNDWAERSPPSQEVFEALHEVRCSLRRYENARAQTPFGIGISARSNKAKEDLLLSLSRLWPACSNDA